MRYFFLVLAAAFVLGIFGHISSNKPLVSNSSISVPTNTPTPTKTNPTATSTEIPTDTPIPTATPKPIYYSPTATPTPYVQQLPNETQTGGGQGVYPCDCGLTCTEISSCAEAQYELNSCGCTQRDADHDGIACDSAPLHCQN